jgi:hypothetical protein
VHQKSEERVIISKGTYLFFDFFSPFIVVPLSPVKWGSRRVTLYLREELDVFGDVVFSTHGYHLAIFEVFLDCFFGMRIVAITPIAEAIGNLLRRG